MRRIHSASALSANSLGFWLTPAPKTLLNGGSIFGLRRKSRLNSSGQLRTEMSESLRRQMAHLTPAQVPVVKQGAADAAEKFFAGGKMNFPAQAFIITGRK